MSVYKLNSNNVFGACLFLESPVLRSAMGGGNGQKAKTARERNMEKQKAAKGIHSFYSLLVYTIIIIKLQILLDL